MLFFPLVHLKNIWLQFTSVLWIFFWSAFINYRNVFLCLVFYLNKNVVQNSTMILFHCSFLHEINFCQLIGGRVGQARCNSISIEFCLPIQKCGFILLEISWWCSSSPLSLDFLFPPPLLVNLGSISSSFSWVWTFALEKHFGKLVSTVCKSQIKPAS